MDLSARGLLPAPGWADMPEVACARACRPDGVSERTVRRLLMFVSAMDRAPDADRLWRAGHELLSVHPEAFDLLAVAAMPIEKAHSPAGAKRSEPAAWTGLAGMADDR